MTGDNKEMLRDHVVNERLREGLGDWRKLAQALHARYATRDLAEGAQLVSAIATAETDMGSHLRFTVGEQYVDLRLVSHDAIYRDGEGNEHVVQWVTGRDLELAAHVSKVAAELHVTADPASITEIELGLDTADSARIAPMWAALLTGSTDAVGHGSIGDDVRDQTERMPVLWFQDTDAHETPRQRFHLDVWVAPDQAEARLAAAVAAGGTVVDDSNAPAYTIVADADGNRACVCTTLR